MIHPTAIIDPTAKIASNVEIGPYSIIGPEVEIGAGTWIGPHVVIKGPTIIGADNKIFQFASLGEMSQDKKFLGGRAILQIGDRNVIREFCTLNRGTAENSKTCIGNDNLFMAYVHIAHDCVVGNHTVFANNASLAGHAIIEDYAILSAFSGVFQFCRVGRYGFLSMGTLIDKDAPPFVKVWGHPGKPFGLNSVGLKRHSFTEETLLNLKRAYKTIYRKGLVMQDVLAELTEMVANCAEIQLFIDFLQNSERGIVR